MEKTIGNLNVKDFLRVLYREKKVLLGSFLGILLLAVMLSFLVTDEYQSESKLMISVPMEVETSYGTYVFNQDQTSDYMNLMNSEDILSRAIEKNSLEISVGALKQAMAVSYDQNLGRNQFSLKVTDDHAHVAKKINQALLEVYQVELREIYGDLAKGSLLAQNRATKIKNEKTIETLESATEKYRDLLNTIEPLYFYKELHGMNPNLAESIARQSGLTREQMEALLEDDQSGQFVNENFFALESEIVKAEAEKILLTEENKQLDLKLEELEQQALLDTELDIFKNNVRVIQQPTEPSQPVRDMSRLVILLGTVVALVGSLVITYLYAFWKEQ